jgi:hypothetical protein
MKLSAPAEITSVRRPARKPRPAMGLAVGAAGSRRTSARSSRRSSAASDDWSVATSSSSRRSSARPPRPSRRSSATGSTLASARPPHYQLTELPPTAERPAAAEEIWAGAAGAMAHLDLDAAEQLYFQLAEADGGEVPRYHLAVVAEQRGDFEAAGVLYREVEAARVAALNSQVGLGRIVAFYHRSFTSYRNREHVRYLYF